MADTLQMVNGRRVFDAYSIEARTLILRSEHDFWSRPEDVRALRADLTTAAAVEYQELKGASHYVHLLPDGRDAFIEAILEFTAAAGG